MWIEGDTSHHDDGSVRRTLQLGTFLGGLKGGSFENFSVESHLGIYEEMRCGILEDMNGIERIKLHIRFAVGNKITQSVSAIDEAHGLVFNPEVEIGPLGKPMGQESDGSRGSRPAFHARNTDHLLPDQSSLGDLDGQRRAAEISVQLGRIDRGPDPVTPKVTERVELGQVDSSSDGCAWLDL